MRPVIFTLTGPSCAGKSTLEKIMVDKLGFANLISETTRAPRPTDVNGVSYYFNTVEQFNAMRDSGALIEHIEFNGDYYGLSAAEVSRITAMGKSIVVVVEPGGRDQIRDYCLSNDIQCISIYVGGDTIEIAERFIWRTLAQYDNVALGEPYAKWIKDTAIRLGGMLGHEREWAKEAKLPFNNPYVMVIDKFDSETEANVIKSIKAINENQYSYPNREVKSPQCQKHS